MSSAAPHRAASRAATDQRATHSPIAFRYRALSREGEERAGVVRASTESEAVEILRDRGEFVYRLRGERIEGSSQRRLTDADLSLGLRTLAALIDSGLPLTASLSAMSAMVPPTWGSTLDTWAREIAEGRSLGDAMLSTPGAIPRVVAEIVRAGESGPGLSLALRAAVEFAERRARSAAELRGALAYPAFLVTTSALAVGFLVTTVVPRFEALVLELGQTPSGAAWLLFGAASLASQAAPFLLAIPMIAVFATIWLRSDRHRARLHLALRRIPVVRGVRVSAVSGRIAGSLSALLASGAPLPTALRFAARVGDDAVAEQRIEDAVEQVIRGVSLSTALGECNALSETVVRLARAGETAGDVPGLISHAARLESARATEAVARATRMIEPIVIVVIGLFVVAVCGVVLSALYGLRVS